LFQEWGVPPWERARVPLLYVGEELAAVVGYCVCEPYHAQQQQSGLKLELASVNRS
jgi:tRNA(Ile)-lysidine synthase